LRSPKANDGARGALGESVAKERGNSVQIGDQVLDLAKANGAKVSRKDANLPTPTAQAAKHSSTPDLNRNTKLGSNLWDLPHILPTPAARDYKDGTQPHERNGVTQTDTVARAIFNGGEIKLGTPRGSSANGPTAKQVKMGAPKGRLEDQVEASMQGIVNWGKFEPAIRRWEEVLGRPAPAPTKPDGKEGAHRLSSRFTEWMMGVPEGWITDCGLTRNEELKACGNGVVPQQAELALRILLEGITLETTGGGQVNLPTPTVSDTFTDNLRSSQQKEGSMHSVTLPQAVRMIGETNATN
jgi:hypothetical protein